MTTQHAIATANTYTDCLAQVTAEVESQYPGESGKPLAQAYIRAEAKRRARAILNAHKGN